MTYRSHRPHALYAPVAGPANPQFRRPHHTGMSASAGLQSHPGLLVGLLYGLPPALLLWAIIVATARAFF